jgi:hypothetical protein
MLGVPAWFKASEPIGVQTRLPKSERQNGREAPPALAGWRWVDKPCELCGVRLGQQRMVSITPDLPAHPLGLYPAVKWPTDPEAAQLWMFDPPYVEWDEDGNAYNWTAVVERLQTNQRCPKSGKYPTQALGEDYAAMAKMARTMTRTAIMANEQRRRTARKAAMTDNMASEPVMPTRYPMPKSLLAGDTVTREPPVPYSPSAPQGRKDGTYSLITKDGGSFLNLTYDQYLKLRQENGDIMGGKPLPPPDDYALPLPKSLQPGGPLLSPSREALLNDLDDSPSSGGGEG